MNGSKENTTAAAAIILIPLSLSTFILNLVTFIILQRSKKLKENNFVRLLLWLSTSDMVLSFTSCVIIGNTFLQLRCINIPSMCFITSLLTSMALSFSLVQVLFVCIERLFATISMSRGSKWSTWYNSVFAAVLAFDATYVSAVYFIYGDAKSSSCKLVDIFGDKYRYYKLFLPFLNLIIVILISIVYGVVFYRLKKRMLTIVPVSEATNSSGPVTNTTNISSYRISGTLKGAIASTSVSSDVNRSLSSGPTTSGKSGVTVNNLDSHVHGIDGRIKRFRRSLSTLIIVIFTVYVCILPSVLTNIASAVTKNKIPDSILEFTNIFILLNPLIDPIVYVLRIKEFRSKLKCRCFNH